MPSEPLSGLLPGILNHVLIYETHKTFYSHLIQNQKLATGVIRKGDVAACQHGLAVTASVSTASQGWGLKLVPGPSSPQGAPGLLRSALLHRAPPHPAERGPAAW